MSLSFKTWTGSLSGPVVAKTVTRPALTGHQVFVKTTHSGVCGRMSITIMKRLEWGTKELIYGSCGECASCQAGYIAMCERLPKQYGQTDFDQGSFSTGGVWDSRFVYRIPDKMKSEDAGPTLCGGWSVWNALIGYDLKPTDHVGVVGIGGLGHFAIQFANKMGCEVTAFSATESKKADSLALGAHHFVNTNLPVGERLKVARQINKLLVCTNAHILWELFTQGLVGKATIFPLQIPTDMASKLSVPHMPFLMKSINLIYSTNGWHDAYDKLLAFAALHSIKSVSEKFPLTGEGIEDALNKLEKGTVRYRGVLAAEA